MLSGAVAVRQAYCKLPHKMVSTAKQKMIAPLLNVQILSFGGIEALCPLAVCFAFAVQGADFESVVRQLKLASSAIYLFSVLVFTAVAVDFGRRVWRNQPYRGVTVGQQPVVSRTWSIEISAMAISSVFMLVRGELNLHQHLEQSKPRSDI
jgi:hypothetical protein